MKEYRNILLVYIFDGRQLACLIPFLRKINVPTLLLSEYDISEDLELSECVVFDNRVFRTKGNI